MPDDAAVWMEPSHLVSWRSNPQKHDVDGIARSIQELGFGAPVVARRETREVIAGHGRVKAALQLGLEQIPVRLLDVDEATAHRLAIADNQLVGEMDAELLEVVVAEEEWDAADLELLGFDDDTAAELLGEGPGEVEEDEPPEPLPDSRTQRGDIITLGPSHRVMCGDSTSAEDVAALMAGGSVDLCLTDPPYGVGVDYASTDDTQENLSRLVSGFLPLARDLADVVFVTTGNGNQFRYPEPAWMLCWYVPAGTGLNRWGFTCWQPILAYGADPYLAKGLGARHDAYSCNAASEKNGHPCPKPLELWHWLIERGSVEKGGSVFDPFLGSGTTLLAADQLDRTCYGMELEPRYVDVIVRRWIAYREKAGKEPAVVGWRGMGG